LAVDEIAAHGVDTASGKITASVHRLQKYPVISAKVAYALIVIPCGLPMAGFLSSERYPRPSPTASAGLRIFTCLPLMLFRAFNYSRCEI